MEPDLFDERQDGLEEEPLRPPGIFERLFGLRSPVDRQFYAVTGFLLIALKYGVDSWLVHARTGVAWMPWHYLNPVFFMRAEALDTPLSTGFQLAMAMWTLPFLWIGVSMTVRRAHDAGHSGWWGLVFFVPLVNYVAMLVLCVLPSRRVEGEGEAFDGALPEPVQASLGAALVAVAISVGLGGGLLLFSVYAAEVYGLGLFAGTPFLLGLVASFVYNTPRVRSVGGTLMVVTTAVGIAGGCLVLFALEGVLCILMAAPIAWSVALLGALIGRTLATLGHASMSPALGAGLVLAGLVSTEARWGTPEHHEVASWIEIDAPPEVVWRHVVSFSELPDPTGPEAFLFRVGVAYPMRARIDGHGVGAIRHCEFSTGAFVEPITVWDEPRRLSFDVTAQPEPMQEWSPYQDLHPPHLDDFIQSRRGEFRLIPLPGGRTRLEGSTWYDLDIHPGFYWRLWSDALIHAIHARVLEHVKALSEAG